MIFVRRNFQARRRMLRGMSGTSAVRHDRVASFIGAIVAAQCFFNTTDGQELPAAWVHASEDGQGFFMTRLDKCVLVTAAHLLGDWRRAEVIAAGNPITPRIPLSATLWGKDLSSDIAVLVVNGTIPNGCGSDFSRGASEEAILSASLTTIPRVESDGQVSRGAYEAPVLSVQRTTLLLGRGIRSGG